ncbi:hypothetical protein D9758_012223 [Tetrapyrgos nigripes]|uniref:Small-subunit processome Utp12 domain-containing protein n=1 Tax=Tetrapyrgos nigripes TaxID=182062 RepID=A0A8H5CAZ7_9AGAR|nr:hypothetical protein D9758_012223 [Tetrapyrgos nigripes]
MASPKKNKSKTSKSRPAATASVSQPVVEDASYLTALSSFSPDGNLFSYLSLAVDKHRLRIYNTVTGQSEAEYIAASARVSALSWCEFLENTTDDDSVPTKKKRRKSQSGENAAQKKTKTLLVGLGLSNGTVQFFSPTHGRVLWTLSHSSSTSAILSIVSVMQQDESPNVWTSGTDGVVRLWNVHKNELLGSWKNEDRIPYSCMTARPGTHDDNAMDILAASHSIRLLATDSNLSSQNLRELASFTGHSSWIKSLQWDASQAPSQRFVSMAEADRVVSIWQVPQSTSQGHMVASVQLDSDARAISLTSSASLSKSTLLTLSASGRICIYPMPEELSSENSKKSQKLPTLLPRSTLSTSSQNAATTQVVAASFVEQEPGRVLVARIVEGIRPVFNVVQYQDETGNFVSEVIIEDVKPGSATESSRGAPNNRYTESSTLAVGSGIQIGHDIEMDELAEQNADGELDVDLAELSLGQRLTALSGTNPLPEDSEEDEEEGASSKKRKGKAATTDISVVPAASLTRTLIQALHSSDTKLLEMCLAHSDQILIRNTVRRLPPQLAIPLITACVERLGRGARGSNMKGGGGGASSQRGTGLITWVKTVLAVHSGHLMTMPDLVARLAGLHATLTSRLALQESLLNLGGRLDMVLSQIEMRSSVAPAPLGPKLDKQTPSKKKTETTHYVEGESEEEEMDVDVEVESGDDAGSIEDVDLGGSSDEESDDNDEEDDEDEEEEDDDEEGPTMNGFIDDEAEEEFTDDEEGDDSE